MIKNIIRNITVATTIGLAYLTATLIFSLILFIPIGIFVGSIAIIIYGTMWAKILTSIILVLTISFLLGAANMA